MDDYHISSRLGKPMMRWLVVVSGHHGDAEYEVHRSFWFRRNAERWQNEEWAKAERFCSGVKADDLLGSD